MPLEVVEDVSAYRIHSKLLREHHVHRLRHEPVVTDRLQWKRSGRDEIVQGAEVILTLEREAAVLHAGVDRELSIRERRHGDAIGERPVIKRIDAVRKLDLTRARWLRHRRAARLAARARRDTELRRDARVVFEISKAIARTELTGGRLPT